MTDPTTLPLDERRAVARRRSALAAAICLVAAIVGVAVCIAALLEPYQSTYGG